MKLVERMSLAILSKVPDGYGMLEEEAHEYALAALKAMREPSDAMASAAGVSWGYALREDYQAMIDAAIREAEAE